METRGVRVLLCEASTSVLRKLVRVGIVRRDAEPIRYFRDLGLALAACEGAAVPVAEPA